MIRNLNCQFLAAISVLSLGVNSGGAAPPDAARLGATSITEADADFALQGEYLGHVTLATGELEYAGLQVVALGDGRFEALYLKGGLPAAGWDRRTKTKLKGQAENGKLSLAGSDTAMVVDPSLAVVRNSTGAELGRLDKIRRISPTLDAAPPVGATVLLSPAADHFERPSLTADGLLNVGVSTKQPVGDFRLHLEFRTPYMPHARGQSRANSGVYIQQRYEVQILDSFGLEGTFDECGALYRQRPPAVNACLPPLSWQTYDIFFTAARWDINRQKTANARITVWHNGEPIHDNVELTDKTGSGKAEGPEPLPINLQNHGNPVHFRNLWLVSGSALNGNRLLSPPTIGNSWGSNPCQIPPDTCRRRLVGWR